MATNHPQTEAPCKIISDKSKLFGTEIGTGASHATEENMNSKRIQSYWPKN